MCCVVDMLASYDAPTRQVRCVGHVNTRFSKKVLTTHIVDALIKFFKILNFYSINLDLYLVIIFSC